MRKSAKIAPSGGLDVTEVIDRGHLTGFQIRVVALCGLIALLDGSDSATIAIAATTIAGKVGVTMREFGLIFSAGTLGAALGAMTFGPLADRLGRQRMLLVAAALFGVFTIMTARATSYDELLTYRLLAGVGLGGATPCFLGLASDYVPQRIRGAIVSLLWSAFPLGIFVGGFFNGYLVRTFGWPAIFYVGGAIALVLVAVLSVSLPESLVFRLGRADGGSERRQAQVRRTLARIAPAEAAQRAVLVARDEKLPGVPVKHLFREGRGLATVLLWMPFFAGFGVLGVAVLFMPSLLQANGASMASAAMANAFNGLGGLIGMAVAGKLVDRLGPTRVLTTALVAGAAATAALGPALSSVTTAAACTAAIGLTVGIASGGAIAVAALAYPAAVRATGIGWGMAMGRFGQVVLPLVAARMIGAFGNGSVMLLVMAALLLLAAVFVVLLGFTRTRGRAAEVELPVASH